MPIFEASWQVYLPKEQFEYSHIFQRTYPCRIFQITDFPAKIQGSIPWSYAKLYMTKYGQSLKIVLES